MNIKSITLCATVMLIAAPAFAFSGISAKYDGKYRGTAAVNASTSAPGCTSYAIDGLNIKGGQLSSDHADVAVRGFITEEGYLDASIKPTGGAGAKLDGRLEGAEISAGAIDNATGCSWIVKLQKAP